MQRQRRLTLSKSMKSYNFALSATRYHLKPLLSWFWVPHFSHYCLPLCSHTVFLCPWRLEAQAETLVLPMTGCAVVGRLDWEPLLQSMSLCGLSFRLQTLRILHLTSPDAVPTFPLPSFLSLLNWHLTFSSLPLNTTPDTPSGMNYWNFAGKILLSFLLATSNVLLFIFVLLFFLSSLACL